MKRKDLKAYIRQEIINELVVAEDATAFVTSKGGTKPVTYKSTSELDPLKRDPNVSSITTTGGQKLKEMARVAVKFKLGNPAKVEKALFAWGGSNVARMIEFVREAGEAGLTQTELAEKLGIKYAQEINPDINLLVQAGVLAKPSKVEPAAAEPAAAEELGAEDYEMAPAEEPGDEEGEEWEEKDEWEKGDEEEETPEVEPGEEEIKKAEKTVGGAGYAKQLSPEDEEKFARLKKGIEAKVSKISKLSKDKQASSDDMKVLKTLINRDDVKKLFKDKGVNLDDLVSDIIA